MNRRNERNVPTPHSRPKTGSGEGAGARRELPLPPGIDSVPDYWHVAKVKHIATVRSSNVNKKTQDGEQPVRLCNYVDVYYNDTISPEMNFMRATASRQERRRFGLQHGDVLVTKDSESWDDIAVPAYVGHDFDDVVCGYHLALIRPFPQRVSGRFLFYCFAAEVLNRQLQVRANGITRFGLPIGALAGATVPVPPLEEQQAIADFLDEKTAAIDALIARKERLIELVEERRQATITRAVTKGLDPDAPMKDSRVEWLGPIPSQWRVMRLKHLSVGPFVYGANEAAEIDDLDLPRYIRITDLRADGTLRDDTFRSLPETTARPYMLRDGDILFARSGATVGKAVRYRAEWGSACFAGYLIRMRPDARQVLPEYLEFYTQTEPYRREVELSTVQATIQNVGAQRYGEFRVPVPDLHEQRRIVDRVNTADYRLKELTAKLHRQIGKLLEYRQALISAAVTGSLDIRGWASSVDEIPKKALA